MPTYSLESESNAEPEVPWAAELARPSRWGASRCPMAAVARVQTFGIAAGDQVSCETGVDAACAYSCWVWQRRRRP